MSFQLKNIFKQLSFNTFIPVLYPFLMLPLKYWRKKAIGMLSFRPGDRVIIPGVGSGHDLTYIPENVQVVGVDISDVMLGIAGTKLEMHLKKKNVNLRIMDAEDLDFPDNSFDKAILGLFLTCVYNPNRAFSEVVRVVKTDGEILIYDHLVRRKRWSKHLLKSMDVIMKYNFCSVIRRFDDIIEGQPVSLVNDIPGDPMGFVKGFLLRKER